MTRAVKFILAVGLFTLLAGCADYAYQRGCNPPLGFLHKCN